MIETSLFGSHALFYLYIVNIVDTKLVIDRCMIKSNFTQDKWRTLQRRSGFSPWPKGRLMMPPALCSAFFEFGDIWGIEESAKALHLEELGGLKTLFFKSITFQLLICNVICTPEPYECADQKVLSSCMGHMKILSRQLQY